jgi:CAAX prenyl protease-like protein
MNPLFKKLESSPLLARAVPFVVFVALTFCQGQFGEAARYWFYVAKTIVGAWLVWTVRPLVGELRWEFSWEAVVAGVTVFGVWVGLDGLYPSVDQMIQRYICPLLNDIGLDSWCPDPKGGVPWNPHEAFGQGSTLAWMFIIVRIFGSTIVVPPLEEVFYRSFFYRYVTRPDFQSVPLGQFTWVPFLVTAAIFGFAHHEWLAGILCAFAYQGLVCRKKRLGDAITAHAITNLLLGLWVVRRGAWNFW